MAGSRSTRIAKQLPSTVVRGAQLEALRVLPQIKSRKKRLFNLDLHISVIRDLAQGLKGLDVDLTQWSISRHNHVFNDFFRHPDPVRFINARSWQDIDEKMIRRFQRYYGKFLSRFDGFLVTHTPVFHEIFKGFDKPILVLNSTRYEAPFTNNEQGWRDLDHSLRFSVNEGQTLIYSNNKGDSKYLEYFSGIESEVVPSVCDYVNKTWRGRKQVNVFMVQRQSPYVMEKLFELRNWRSSSEVFGGHFAWGDIAEVACLFLVPYNISTMQLFELSTAGIPVVVPSKKFLAELFFLNSSLGEVSFFQTNRFATDSLQVGNPNNYSSTEFLDFWIERADFYDRELMPNVFYVDSFQELDHFKSPTQTRDYIEQCEFRNNHFVQKRHLALARFMEMI